MWAERTNASDKSEREREIAKQIKTRYECANIWNTMCSIVRSVCNMPEWIMYNVRMCVTSQFSIVSFLGIFTVFCRFLSMSISLFLYLCFPLFPSLFVYFFLPFLTRLFRYKCKRSMARFHTKLVSSDIGEKVCDSASVWVYANFVWPKTREYGK